MQGDAYSTTHYFDPMYRRSPFFEATLRHGCKAYRIYNHMYLPDLYDDPIAEYWALVNGVTLWDVGVERIVEISGPDGFELANMLTCRDLSKCAVGQGKYALITAPDGGIVNDPVLLRRDESTFWLSLADSDAYLYALGVAEGRGLDAKVSLPEAYALQVQGPKAKHVLAALLEGNEELAKLRYYWTLDAEIAGIPVVISRTGWSAEVGYEMYLLDPARGDDLWEAILSAGQSYGIRPIAPCSARRIEGGIFSYGSDITLANNPFEISGLERLVEEQDADYIGKGALEAIRARGVTKKLVGLEVAGEPLPLGISKFCPALHEGNNVGHVTALVWSPRLERNIGYVFVPIELSGPGTPIDVVGPLGELAHGTTTSIPFVDPTKSIPARL